MYTHTHTLDTHINFYICSPQQQLPPPSRFLLVFCCPFRSTSTFPCLSLAISTPPLPPLYSQTNFVVVCLILLLSKLPLPNAFANSLTLLFFCRIAYTTCCTRRTILFFSSALIPLLFRLCVLCVVWHVLLVSRYDEFIPFCCHYRNCCSLFSCCSPSRLLLLLFVLSVFWVWVAVAVYFTQKPNRLFGTLL